MSKKEFIDMVALDKSLAHLRERPCVNCKDRSGSISAIPFCLTCYTLSNQNTKATPEFLKRRK